MVQSDAASLLNVSDPPSDTTVTDATQHHSPSDSSISNDHTVFSHPLADLTSATVTHAIANKKTDLSCNINNNNNLQQQHSEEVYNKGINNNNNLSKNNRYNDLSSLNNAYNKNSCSLPSSTATYESSSHKNQMPDNQLVIEGHNCLPSSTNGDNYSDVTNGTTKLFTKRNIAQQSNIDMCTSAPSNILQHSLGAKNQDSNALLQACSSETSLLSECSEQLVTDNNYDTIYSVTSEPPSSANTKKDRVTTNSTLSLSSSTSSLSSSSYGNSCSSSPMSTSTVSSSVVMRRGSAVSSSKSKRQQQQTHRMSFPLAHTQAKAEARSVSGDGRAVSPATSNDKIGENTFS